MTGSPSDTLSFLQAINATAAFNRWAGIEVTAADATTVELRLSWREELGQYAGFLHAGVITALIDTACGFAGAASSGGNVTASHCAVNFLAPARGDAFVARARVVKAGRRQLFVTAELHAEQDRDVVLVATGDTILVPLPGP